MNVLILKFTYSKFSIKNFFRDRYYRRIAIKINQIQLLDDADIQILEISKLILSIRDPYLLGRCYVLRAQMYEGQHQNELAIDDYNQAATYDPDSDSFYQIGLLYELENNLDLALTNYLQAIEYNSKHISSYFQCASIYFLREDFENALIYTNQAMHLELDATSYYNRGVAYARLNRYDLALKDYEKALEYDPEYSSVYGNLAIYYFKMQDLEQALINYNKAIEYDPLNSQPYYNRGLLYKRREEYDLAIEDFKENITLTSNGSDAHFQLGWVYKEIKNEPDVALEHYTCSIEIDPEQIIAYNNRSIIYREKGEFTLAIQDSDMAINNGSMDPTHYRNRGLVYEELGITAKALIDYSFSIEIEKDSIVGYTYRCNLYKKLGYIMWAIRDYDRLIEITPDSTIYPFECGTLCLDNEKYDLAIKYFDITLKIDPKYANAYNDKGWALEKKGDYNGAHTCYSKAIECEPFTPLFYINRSNMNWRKGNLDMALKDKNTALELENKNEFYKLHIVKSTPPDI